MFNLNIMTQCKIWFHWLLFFFRTILLRIIKIWNAKKFPNTNEVALTYFLSFCNKNFALFNSREKAIKIKLSQYTTNFPFSSKTEKKKKYFYIYHFTIPQISITEKEMIQIIAIRKRQKNKSETITVQKIRELCVFFCFFFIIEFPAPP